MTDAQATILARMVAGAVLTHSLQGDRLWSLLGDPFTVLDDVSPRLLREAGLIALDRRGNVKADRADIYRLTLAGRTALAAWQARR